MSDDGEGREGDEYKFEPESGEESADEAEDQYYEAKALKDSDCAAALAALDALQQGEKGEWGFKALKQMVKMFAESGSVEEMLAGHGKMLAHLKTASVSRRMAEKHIGSMIGYLAAAP